MVGLLGGDDRGVGRQHEVDARVGHQVRLELGDVDVQGPVEAQAGRQGADDLGDQAVQVGVGRALDVQVPVAKPGLEKGLQMSPGKTKKHTMLSKSMPSFLRQMS